MLNLAGQVQSEDGAGQLPDTMQAMPENGESLARIDAFKANIRAQPNDEEIVREHVLHAPAFAVADGVHYALKRRISEKYSVDPNQDVFVVGSAKLGFSIAPAKRYKPFDDGSAARIGDSV